MVANLLLLACLPSILALSFPGVAIQLDESATEDFIQGYIVNAVNDAEEKPDQIYNLTIGYFFTKMKYQFYNVNFHNIKIEQNQVNLEYNSIDDVVTVVIGKIDLALSANFTLNWFGTYHGWASVIFKNATFKIPAELGASKSKATLIFQKASITYSNFDFKLHSNNPVLSISGWLEYIWGFEYLFNSLTLNKIENIFKNQNSIIEKYFNNLPYLTYIGNQGLAIDYSPISVEVNKNNMIIFNLNGDFSIPKKNLEYPQKMDSYLTWALTSNVRIMLTDYFFNSYFWGLSNLGDLNFTLSSETVPSYSSILTTDGLKLLLPGLYNTYGSGKAVNISFSVLPYTTIALYTGTSRIRSTIQADIYIEGQGSDHILALSFKWNSTTRIGLWFSQSTNIDSVNYEIFMNSTQFSQYVIVSSNIGDVDLDSIQNALNFAISSIVMFINPSITKNSIPLPIPKYLSISNPVISVQNRNLEIGGTLDFNL